MAEVTMQQVKELRERTQAGMSDCKSALVEAGGDMEKAVEILLKKGQAKSAKRAGAIATEGAVAAIVAPDGRSGAIVEVNVQTDFAARNDRFVELVGEVVRLALGAPADVSAADVLAMPYRSAGKTVAQVRDELVGAIGEKVDVRRVRKFALRASYGLVHLYVHPGGKIGVLLEVETSTDAAAGTPELRKLADDVAMQVAWSAPLCVRRDEIDAAAVKKQEEIYLAQVKEEKKPEAAWPKIVQGKLAKWYSEVCLLEQDLATSPGKRVDEVRAAVAAAIGADVRMARFVRFERGEGIEKPKDDFAAEAARMAGGS